MDTLRILFWKSPLTTRGLSLRQRLQFLEVGLFYLSSVPTLILILTPACCLLFDVRMFSEHVVAHVAYSIFYVLLLAAYMFILGNGTSWREVLRAKQMWVGLMFVYVTACVRALSYGPDRKPAYRVTRKVQRADLYLQEVAPHIALVVLFVVAIVRHLLLLSSGVPYARWVGDRIQSRLRLARRHRAGATTSADLAWVRTLLADGAEAMATPFQPCLVVEDYKEAARPPRPGFARRATTYLLLDRALLWEFFQRHGLRWWPEEWTFRDWAGRYLSLLGPVLPGA